MNSPLPKPTPPKNNDDQNQTVVFDQSMNNAGAGLADNNITKNDNSKMSSRIPLTQKPAMPVSQTNSGSTPLAATPTPAPAQKTVLGQPIPQTIRGEAVPTAFGKPAPISFSSGSEPINSTDSESAVTTSTASPIPTVPKILPGQQGSAPVLQQDELSEVKKENQNPDGKGNNKSPKIATVKSPIMKFLPFIIGGVILLIIVLVVLARVLGGGKSSSSVSNNQSSGQTPLPSQQPQRTEIPAEQTTVVYWGLWEPSEVMDQVIADFETENPGIKINYIKQSPIDYRERLQTAIKSGKGPDLFRFHASWLPMLKTDIDPIPASVVSVAEFKDNYYPVVTEQLADNGKYFGLPLMYDGLVLYYNEDILGTADETPPKTWPDLRNLAIKLTIPSASGIQRGGLAIGNATNVEHFSDILATLILQNGGNLSEADSIETRDALLFYTNFQLSDKVWDESLPSSTVAFARGDVAMMFAPSWRAHEINALNPDLNFSTTSMPQLSENEKVAWASYWAEGISSSSDHKEEATKFLAYLNRKDVLQKFFSSASQVRGFGEIYPRVDMSDEIADNKVIGAVLEDALYSQSGYLNSFTHDNGINDLMIDYYKVAIESLIQSEDIEDVQTALDQGVTQVLKQYSVNSK